MSSRSLLLCLLLGLSTHLHGGWAWTSLAGQETRGGVHEQDPRGSVQGRILGRQGSAVSPLPNAVVDVTSGPNRFTVISDGSGRYALEQLAEPGGVWGPGEAAFGA